MKKFLAFVFAALIVCAAFLSCGKRKSATDKIEPTDTKSTTAGTVTTTKPAKYTGIVSIDKESETKEPVDLELIKIVDIYKTRLKLLLDGGYKSFALIDLNGDGVLELITKKYVDNMTGYYDYMVYHHDDGKLFSYATDGGALTKFGSYKIKRSSYRGEYKLVLENYSIKSKQIWYIGNEGTIFEEYYSINHEHVSKQEVEKCMQNSCEEMVEWYEFTNENIDKYITAENLNNASLLCRCGYSRIIELYKSFYEFAEKNENAFSLSFDELYEIFGISEDENERKCFNSVYAAVVNARGGAYYAGYAEKDLNGDGYSELILLTYDYRILGIYTRIDGKRVPVEHKGFLRSIDTNGNIYISASGKGENWVNLICRLSENGELVDYFEYGCLDYGYADSSKWEYYTIKNGKISFITESELTALNEEYGSFFNYENTVNSELGFIPLFEDFDPSDMK